MSTTNIERSLEDEDRVDLLPYFSEVAVLLKNLEDLSKSLTTSQVKQYDEAGLTVRLDYVEDLYKDYRKAQSVIDRNKGSASDSGNSMVFLSLYFDVKSKISRQITSLRKTESSHRSSTFRQFSLDESPPSQCKTKVPEIQLPKFRGSYSEWPNFFSLFSTIINDNNELSNLEKFHYLRSNLEGVALDTIASLELTEANYDEALALLKNRFDNKLLNFQTHVKGIFALKCVENVSAVSLRRLSDGFNAHLRAMQSIGSQQQILDGFLIHLVATKLDTKSLIKWEESLPINELPTWATMAAFLEKRCRMAENCENSIGKIEKPNVSKKSNANRHVHVSVMSQAKLCYFCDSKDHFISGCSRFLNLSPILRFKEAKNMKLCINCLRKGHMVKNCASTCCRSCSLKHHTLLHNNSGSDQSPASFTGSSSSQAVLISSGDTYKEKTSPITDVFLATAVVKVKDKFGSYLPCRAILDSASQLNLITNRFANFLNLKGKRSLATISGLGDGSITIKKSVDLAIKSRDEKYSTSLEAMVVPSITSYQPSIVTNTSKWKIPKNIELADPSFDKCGRIDMLIGAKLFFDLLSIGQIKLAQNLPILQKTLLGWVVAGGTPHSHHSWSLAVSTKIKQDDELCSVIKSFWEIENNFGCCGSLSEEDIFCENYFLKNTARLECGSFSVKLPEINEGGRHSLGDSYEHALSRFKGLERKFRKNPDIKAQYAEFMAEYKSLKHMSLISPQVPEKKYFLPHHCVLKLDSTSTKLRVVFDGSAKTTTGLSLNDILCTGPTIQPKLFNTLLRYRCFKVALSGDICKMYRCVRVSHPDNFLQCILWRENEEEEIKTYSLDTVTYGTRPAAFLSIRAMHQLAEEEKSNYPIGAKIVKRDFYVDDMLSGGDTINEVREIRNQVTALLQRGNFLIRKWCSNMPAVLNDLPSEQCEKFLKFDDGTDITKTLGLVWDPHDDNFIFTFNPIEDCKVVTKRSVLSSIARLYDPLGLIGPIITKAKIFMQHLWKLELHWDESLPQSLHSTWLEYISQFNSMQYFKFPRCVLMSNLKVQIHAFCDASLAAFGACVYVRSQTKDVVQSSLLCSKSRVSPLKSLTVPKLELAAACLLAELVEEVVKTLPYDCDVHCWSDSMVVLSWLREQPSNFNVFVSNRVSRIQTITNKMTWHYVPTDLNPADILSRGASPTELLNCALWSNGPDFLSSEPSKWPSSVEFLTELPERRRNVLAAVSLSDLALQCKYHNSFAKMQRIFAYVFKFAYPKLSNKNVALTPADIKNGTYLLIKNIQLIHFATEYKALKLNKNLPSSSKLHSLMPILDTFGLIRVGGRLQHSNLDFEAKHPIILPKHHPLTSSLIMYFHQKLLHGGPQFLLATIRQQYWPIGGRKLISSVISKCVRCFRLKPVLSQHVMGSLPTDRVNPSRAFHTTGIDFCGPFYYKSEIRNRPPIKCYVSIFVCFATKATHMEVVHDLSTLSFLSALRRFIAIRGKPKIIWSDNATNFVGAKNELADIKRLFLSESHQKLVQQQCLEDEIEWKFIPPRSPHFGGLWEAAVKSAKQHFYRTVGLNKLTFDELRTLVYQISAILNSRPLCPITEDCDDLDVLTPGHFLIGGPLVFIGESNIIETDMSRLTRWQRVTQLQQIFWQKWSRSYLSLLQERTKWHKKGENITCGTMVLLKDENLPPLKWQLGRISEVIPGDDNIVRVAVVRTANGLIKRAVTKLAVLPIESYVC